MVNIMKHQYTSDIMFLLEKDNNKEFKNYIPSDENIKAIFRKFVFDKLVGFAILSWLSYVINKLISYIPT
jgi:hypothetical protein